MTVSHIRLFPDPCLAQECASVSHDDRTLESLISDLKETMAVSPGVGLAAPQIGVMKRVSVIDVGRIKKKIETSNNGLIVLINATLIQGEGIQIPREGCLSVPDLLANVRRFRNVIVQTEISQGVFRTIKAHGLEALALQHELDHLQGKLFLDRVSNLKTDIFRRKNY